MLNKVKNPDDIFSWSQLAASMTMITELAVNEVLKDFGTFKVKAAINIWRISWGRLQR